MANKEIKHTIRLDGEKEYSAAIRDAQRNLRTLRSELKAETAELGANATAQQKNEARSKSLKAQIAEQEKVVETLKKALAEAKKDYGDNEDVVQKWEQKLNEARTTLANMQNGLADTENAMRGVSGATAEGVTATKSFADALDSIASVGESVSGAIEDIFTGLIGTVRDVVVDLWDLIGETAAKANNWTDIAGYWGTEPVEVQKWDHAVRSTSKDFADFQTMISRFALGGKEKQITEMLGISDVNYESQWDYAIACMEQISRMTKDGTLPDNFWEEIFGEKKATKAMNIINDWDSIQQNLAEFDPENGGFGLNEEQTAAMNQYKMDMDELVVKWEALKDSVAAGLGVIAADLLVNVSGGLDALNDYLNADTEEERQAAIQKLETNVRELFEKVAAAIEAGLEVLAQVGSDLQNSDDPIVQAIGNILTGITNALEWLVGHDKEVVAALRAIFGTWLTAKLATIAGKLASIVADIQTIQMFKGWSSGAAASGAANAASGAANGAGAAAGGAATWLGNLGMSFGMAGGASVAVPAAVLAAAGYAGAKMIDANLQDAALNAVYGGEGGEGDVIDTMSDESLRRAWDYYRLYSDESMTGTEEAFAARDRLFESLADDGIDLSEQAVSLLENTFDNALEGSDIDGLVGKLEQRYPGFFDQRPTWDAGINIQDQLASAIYGAAGQGAAAAQEGLTSDDVSMFRGLPGLMRQALMSRINGIEVVMDGEKVGRLVMPYVGGGFYRMVTE